MTVVCIGTMCPCIMNFVVPSIMQDIEQDQLPRETISRIKDCNGDLIACYFEVLVDVPFVVRRKKMIRQAH